MDDNKRFVNASSKKGEEMLIKDFEKEMLHEEAEEKDGQDNYEQFMKDSDKIFNNDIEA